MSNANSSGAPTRSRLLSLTFGALALALVFNAVTVPAAYAGGASGGVLGDKHSQGGKHSSGVETSGRKPGAASGSGA